LLREALTFDSVPVPVQYKNPITRLFQNLTCAIGDNPHLGYKFRLFCDVIPVSFSVP